MAKEKENIFYIMKMVIFVKNIIMKMEMFNNIKNGKFLLKYYFKIQKKLK